MKISFPLIFLFHGAFCVFARGQSGTLPSATSTVLESLGFNSPDSLVGRLRKANSLAEPAHWGADVQTIYFSQIYLSYYGRGDYGLDDAKRCLEKRQRAFPVLAQIIFLGSKQLNHFTWLQGSPDGTGESYYERLKQYLDYWSAGRDGDGNGLPCGSDPPPSGESDGRRVERVELITYLRREYQAMSGLAHQLRLPDDVAYYRGRARELAVRMNAVLWDEEEGCYYDRDEATGTFIRIKDMAGFLPLSAGMVPYERAERLIRGHFDRAREDFFKVWSRYMAFQGLMDYGYRKQAKLLADDAFHLAFRGDQAAEGNPWFGLACLMPWEYELNYTPSTLSWQPLVRLVPEYLKVEWGER